MRLELLADRGVLSEFLAKEARVVTKAVTLATTEATKAVKDAARAEVVRGFPTGAKFAKGIRAKDFKDGDIRVASLVYSTIGRRGPGGVFIDYLATFEKDRVITGRGSGWLIVPNQKGGSRFKGKDAETAARDIVFGFSSGRLRFLAGRDRNVHVVPTKKPGVMMIVKTKSKTELTGSTVGLAVRRFKFDEIVAFLVRRVRIRKRVDFTALLGIRDRTIEETLTRELAG